MWAVMDIGTNSCRLLLAERGETGRKIKRVQAYLRITKLGEGMNKMQRKIGSDALNRTLSALQEFSALIEKYQTKQIILVATQAVRAAENKDVLIQEIKNKLNWELRILTGDEEAQLSYAGALAGLADETPKIVVDIGGGSTEFAWNEKDGTFQAVSVALGALRLLENPLNPEEIMAQFMRALADKGENGESDGIDQSMLVGVGGTCTTAAAIDLQMKEYDAVLVQGHQLTIETIIAQHRLLENIAPAERLLVPGITKGRETIIVSGLQILIAVMRTLRKNVITISDQDLLYGLLLKHL